MKKIALTGDEAVAQAMKQINPDVVAAYPITPQTEIVERFSEFVANGEVDTEFVAVESEHSAMSATVGASAAGGRVMTATSANGLALMWEVVYIAASTKLPIVMPVVNRALSAPINIHCDHSDSMGARDSGWIQLYSENAQEAYDNVIQAIRIAEEEKVRLPVMVTLDGFIISHALERVDLLEDEEVKNFIGEFKAVHPLLDVDHPLTYGPLDLYDYYFEHKRQQAEAMKFVPDTIKGIGKEYEKISGRKYDLLEKCSLDDAEVAIVVLGSTAGTVKEVVKNLRKKGRKVGMLKIRTFRPFPKEEILQALGRLKAVAVLDRSCSFGGYGGPVFSEVRSALLDSEKYPPVVNYIYGLGGRDIGIRDIEKAYSDLEEIAKTKKVKEPISYLGVRE
jgi:pyruvate ferredoxin oxidoreductase alpha subunit